MFQNFIDLLTAPTAAFTRLKQTPGFLAPMVLLLAMTIAATCGYLLYNDEGFVKDEIVAQATHNRDLTKEQHAAIEKAVDNLSLKTQAAISSLSVAILLPIVLLIYSGYLSLCGKFYPQQLEFKHWLSLATWITVPSFFSNLASLLVLFTSSSGQVSQSDLHVLGLIHLLNIDIHSQTLEQFGVMQIWSLVLGAIGFRHWTGSSWTNAILVSLAPTVLIYGAVAYFTL